MIEEVTLHNLDWSEATCETAGRALSVERITQAIGARLAENDDISRFTVTVRNLAVGFNTFATLEGP
jgi:GTP cyclohydrolase I